MRTGSMKRTECRRQKWKRVGASILLPSACLFLHSGCTSRITPPCEPIDPRPVFLIDYGYHASIVLPREDDGLVEFAFGEYEWFAQNHCNGWRAVELVLWPHAGTLGTRELPGPPQHAHIELCIPSEH